MIDSKLLFEQSAPGKKGYTLPGSEVPTLLPDNYLPPKMLRQASPNFPELSEVDIVRHYTNLSRRNHGVDTGFYPLGSCTMKYNPKINEDLAQLENLQQIHPLCPDHLAQGSLEIIHLLQESLAEITGMDAFTLQPAAGAQGELTAMLIIKSYFKACGETQRLKVLVPTSAHGTNPASAAMAGFETIAVNCDQNGQVDLEHLKSLLDSGVAALMLTNPSTLGLFEAEIETIARLVHQAGSLLYYDGANLNAIMGLVRPGDMGFDLIHLNLHKTFATPHGGGGPGAGPVGVKSFLAEFLPVPVIVKDQNRLRWDYNRPRSIGKILGFYGNYAVLVKALAYIMAMGATGLRQVSQDAVLNANYLRAKLQDHYHIPYNRPCLHEFVISAANLKAEQIRTLDIAKRLIDFGYHPPTIYFPLIVEEAMMIEPTETESKETLDRFIETLIKIKQEVFDHPELLHDAPHNAPVGRVDEARAARNLKLRWETPSSI